jgi:DNA polymerase-3 subunit alpha
MNLKGNIMSNIKSIKFIGKHQTYDLEVNHPDHQFYLSNGMLTSNSHAALYSMVSYRTAHLKCHYPLEFAVANIIAEYDLKM